jgi:two-component system, cell cycle sensor histidine kinase and response regulator CckA
MSKNKKTTYELFENWQLAEASQSVMEEGAKSAETADSLDEELLMGDETILFVDDEAMIIDVARDMLEILGYKVIIAQNGLDAVNIYAQRKDEIDLVIQDMVMPGMNGAQTFQALKKINPEVKVILASGYVMNKQIAAVMEQGCRAFMQKPFRLEDLSRKVREVLDAP